VAAADTLQVACANPLFRVIDALESLAQDLEAANEGAEMGAAA
jgi:hypothetical protein